VPDLAPDPRLIELEGAFNFRDLGGYPAGPGRRTRWRRLFRSDTLSELTPGDLATLEALGVATVIDLRTSAEVDRDGRVDLDPRRVHYAHLSVLREEAGESAGAPGGDQPAERYLWYLSHNSPTLVRAIELIGDPTRAPLVFHCAAGKDRTGVLAALVLSLVGVDREVVVADYALTAERMPLIVERLRRHPVYGPRMAEVPSATFGVRADTMARFLEGLDERYGGPFGWAAEAGVDPSVVAALDELLVEEAPDDGAGPAIPIT
jgi:rhodanese-related sulfurtransferase